MNMHPLNVEYATGRSRNGTATAAFHLPVADREACIKDLPGSTGSLLRNDYLIRMGSPVDSLYIVCGGVLKCCTIAPDGDEQVVAFYRTGDMLAFDAFATGTATCNVMAIDSTVVKVVPARTVLKACRESADIQQELLHGMNREIRRLTGKLQLERRSAEQRVASFLVEQSDFEAARGCSRTEFTLPMSRTDMGKYLNLTTETVSRTFSRLQEQGLLATERKRIHLKNLAGIYQLAMPASAAPCERLCA